MRELCAEQITQVVKRLCIEANCFLPRDMKDKGEALRCWVEDTLNAEGEMVYHVIITFDVADFV